MIFLHYYERVRCMQCSCVFVIWCAPHRASMNKFIDHNLACPSLAFSNKYKIIMCVILNACTNLYVLVQFFNMTRPHSHMHTPISTVEKVIQRVSFLFILGNSVTMNFPCARALFHSQPYSWANIEIFLLRMCPFHYFMMYVYFINKLGFLVLEANKL